MKWKSVASFEGLILRINIIILSTNITLTIALDNKTLIGIDSSENVQITDFLDCR